MRWIDVVCYLLIELLRFVFLLVLFVFYLRLHWVMGCVAYIRVYVGVYLLDLLVDCCDLFGCFCLTWLLWYLICRLQLDCLGFDCVCRLLWLFDFCFNIWLPIAVCSLFCSSLVLLWFTCCACCLLVEFACLTLVTLVAVVCLRCLCLLLFVWFVIVWIFVAFDLGFRDVCCFDYVL